MRAVRLGFTDLRGADLIGCDAGKAEFTGANMSDTNCYVAAFWESNLTETDLSNADMRVVNLRSAKLIHTVLHKTRLQEASIGGTVFAGIDFTGAIGLSEIEYWKPCYIDIDTLYQSKGDIPETFLRGCGIPETMIAYVKSIVNGSKPFEFYKVFMSFSSQDTDFADRLFRALDEKGISCWKYDREQHLGHDVYDNIDTGLKTSDLVVFVSSKSSWESRYVIEEVKYALSREQKTNTRILIPVTIDDRLSDADSFLMDIISRKIYANFNGWENNADIFEKGVAHLVSALNKVAT